MENYNEKRNKAIKQCVKEVIEKYPKELKKWYKGGKRSLKYEKKIIKSNEVQTLLNEYSETYTERMAIIYALTLKLIVYI